MALGLEYHLNTCFKHFIFFIDEFKLVEEKELAPLSELIQQFKLRKEAWDNMAFQIDLRILIIFMHMDDMIKLRK